jgi:ankyrin repeat protein
MDHHGNTPLIWAASEGNDDIVQLLVEQGANVNTQNFAGETALFLAAAR